MRLLSPILSLLGVCLLGLDGVLARGVKMGGSDTVDLTSPVKGISFQRTKAMREPSVDAPATHYQSVKPFKGRIAGRSAADALRLASSKIPGSGYQNITALTDYSTQYAIEVMWDNQPLWLLFDSGSSDTWAVKSNFTCTSQFGSHTQAESACAWGPHFVHDFRYGENPNLHFSVTFGSGETAGGPLGRSDITVSGITVREQLCGLANTTYWLGNNVTNGILGLGYPALTSAYTGPMGDERDGFHQDYQPFFSSMISQGLIEPYFAVAIERGSSSGMIGWGGLPPVEWSASSTAYTDILIANIVGHEASAYNYAYYTIVVDGFQYGQTTNLDKYLYIVDTGTTLMYLPPSEYTGNPKERSGWYFFAKKNGNRTELAEAIANSFEPRGAYLFQYGSYFAPCDAVAPRIAVIIDGARFWINPTDLIYKDLVDAPSGMCMLGISTGGYGPYILGSVFLQNVLAVFDVGAAQMRFYSRE